MFLLYINDIIIDIKSDIGIFADDVSLLHIGEETTSFDDLQDDLKISVWDNQWRLRFNPDITKPAVEVIFPPKTKLPLHQHFNVQYCSG